MMVAAGIPEQSALVVGNTNNEDGATPKEHCKIAPFVTIVSISYHHLSSGKKFS